jgi:[acyl-carrier-protein] S-malonyltransferase
VSTLCWEGPAERLDDTRQTQPCLVATSLAALAALREASADAGLTLDATLVAGHSVGEYAALAAAGVLSVADAVRLVARRGELMADALVEGGMAAVIGLERDKVARVLARLDAPDELVVANDNAPGQVVISGTRRALERATERLTGTGARRIIPLRVSGPFHSPLMAPVADELAKAFTSISWSNADPPVVSNVTAKPTSDAGEIRDLLARQVRLPVEWVSSIRLMRDAGVETFVECGPGNALTGMVRRIAPEARTLNVSDSSTLQATVDALRQAPVRVAREASA